MDNIFLPLASSDWVLCARTTSCLCRFKSSHFRLN